MDLETFQVVHRDGPTSHNDWAAIAVRPQEPILQLFQGEV
jgi:hypothetical protein